MVRREIAASDTLQVTALTIHREVSITEVTGEGTVIGGKTNLQRRTDIIAEADGNRLPIAPVDLVIRALIFFMPRTGSTKTGFEILLGTGTNDRTTLEDIELEARLLTLAVIWILQHASELKLQQVTHAGLHRIFILDRRSMIACGVPETVHADRGYLALRNGGQLIFGTRIFLALLIMNRMATELIVRTVVNLSCMVIEVRVITS